MKNNQDFPRQGQVWLAQLVGKNRPRDRDNPHHIRRVVILSTDAYNRHQMAYIAAPILPLTRKRDIPSSAILEAGEVGATERSVIYCVQMRAIAPWRLERMVDALSLDALGRLKDALRVTFDLI